MGLHGLVQSVALLFLYIAEAPTSQETLLWTSTTCYGDRFTFSYADGARSSQETLVWTSTSCHGDRFTFSYADGAGARGSVVVKALCYKPEGRGFETR
jgi:hypothetical protein